MIKHHFVAFNNCSVYSGNSGGPSLIENTNIVLGLPTSLNPGTVYAMPANKTTSMDSTATFVAKNLAKLTSLGVSIVKPYSSGTYVPPYKLLQGADGLNHCYRTSEPVGSPAVDPSWCMLDKD